MPEISEIDNNNDALVIEARTDANALGQLYELYYPRILKFCVYRLFDKQIAEDVTSVTFLAVASGIQHFKGETERDFANWVYAIASNKANSCIRKKLRRKSLYAKIAKSIAPASCCDRSQEDDWSKLYEAISRLSVKRQTIITLRFFENFNYEEIAKIMNLSPASIRIASHRAMKELKYYITTVRSLVFKIVTT